MPVTFSWTSATTVTTLEHVSTGLFDFVNLKNKAEGARRYGYTTSVRRYENPNGEVAFAGEFQTTLNGSSYQSSKRSAFFPTEDAARAALAKTIAGAAKRYAKLATNPAASKIERI